MSLPKIPFTKTAYELMQTEFRRLQQLRQEAMERLKTAREMGDLSENGAYRYAKFELGSLGRQLRELRFKLKNGYVPIIKSGRNPADAIDFGSTVTVRDGENFLTFLLVSQYESDPAQNKLSTESPIGRAVVGKRVGDVVKVKLPAGEREFEITHCL